MFAECSSPRLYAGAGQREDKSLLALMVRGSRLKGFGLMPSAQQYRERAALCLRIAGATHDPALREQLTATAADYIAMAETAEREGDEKPSDQKI
jgi:hypothetical protein